MAAHLPLAADASANGALDARARLALAIHASAVEPIGPLLALAAGLGAAALAALDAIMRPNAIAAYIHSVAAYAIARELIPLVVIVAIALRSGPALAVEIASAPAVTRTSGEARRARRIIVAESALSLALAATGLVVWMSAAALIGGSIITSLAGLAPVGLRLPDILAEISPGTLAASLGKAALAGALMGVIGALSGFSSDPASPRVAARAASCAATWGLVGGVAISLAISLAPLAPF